MYKVRFKNSDSENMKKFYAELSTADAEFMKEATRKIEKDIENYFNLVDEEIKETRKELVAAGANLDAIQFKEWERLMTERRDETVKETISLDSLIIEQI